ncbi:MAG: MauE/DoxX family redox-associated membrane protein [Acidimicrobiales bacterium]
MEGPYAIVCIVLALAGATKIINPLPTAQALRGSGLPSTRVLVRVLGAAELALAVMGLTTDFVLAAVGVGVMYVGFAGFIVLALSKDSGISCGCFGASSAEPTWGHVVLNVAAAGAALASATVGPQALSDTLTDQPAYGLPFVGLALIGAVIMIALFTVLPETLTHK